MRRIAPRIALARWLLCLTLLPGLAAAGPLRDALKERRQAQAADDLREDDRTAGFALPSGATVKKDIAYGNHPRQRLDVYLPARQASAAPAPVILLVHGGAWRLGDKAMHRVVENKVKHWLAQGVVLVSTNYRLLPDANPLQQAEDVAHALAKAQALAGEWGADPQRVVLMGHSAGAHLVALLNASPARAAAAGALPWRGTVALDSAAMDVVQVMQARHMRLYDQTFGKDTAFWEAASPTLQLAPGAPPLLAVCSSRRDDSCAQANGLKARADALGVRVQVLPQDLSHSRINENLGLPGDYTTAVDAFLAPLLWPSGKGTPAP